jgi:hypothetical protein
MTPENAVSSVTQHAGLTPENVRHAHRARTRSSASGLAFAACSADLGVGDLVGEQGIGPGCRQSPG